MTTRARSARLEQEDGDLSEVEVDEVLCLVGDIAAKVSTDDTVPGGVVFLVEFLLDESGNVLFDVELLEGLGGDIYCVLLHVLRHICIFDNCLSIRHCVLC